MFSMSPFEIGIIALIVVLLFGTRRLPELGSGLGQAISNFKKSFREGNAIDVTPDEEKKDKSGSKDSEKKE